MSLKQMNVKQAEKWLEKLKNENLQSYKDITKFLRKYEKTEDQHDCYVKVSYTLLSHAELTKELNTYLQEGNRLVVNKPQDEKIKELMAYIKKNRPEIFERIIKMIQQLSKSQGDNAFEICQSLKPRLKEIISGDAALQRITEEALDLTGEELINRKNLEHLKIFRHNIPVIEQEKEKEISKPLPSKSQPERQIVKNEDKFETNRRQAASKSSKAFILNFTNPSEEKVILKHLQKSLDKQIYLYIIKIFKIYHLNIITRNEAFELLSNVQIDENYMECIKDILDARETQRRKTSLFKPLNDMNFSNCQRPSPSYVSMSPYYPIRCSGKSEAIKALTNQKWVSVPHGSEENENFSVRNKNSNQLNLLKAEDQRYQFDLYMRRLTKTMDMLDQVLDEKSTKTQKQKSLLITKVIEMGVLQLLYKNSSKQQKQQFQCFLSSNNLQTCKVFRDKIAFQVNQLKGIKDIHANKNWNEVATKNFYKALDLKGFQFKKNEKEKMKSSYFMIQLQERIKILQNGGQIKNQISFDDKKDFFTILNSFQSSSRSQKCSSRNLPLFECYNLSDQSRRHFYPIMILAFQENSICQQLYSLSLFFIDSIQMNEQEKIKCKNFLYQFLGDYLGWKRPVKRVVSEAFNQQKLYQKIASQTDENLDTNDWLIQNRDDLPHQNCAELEERISTKMKFLNDAASVYSYLPVKSKQKLVFYGSEHLYNLIRFIYTIYERIIKMREVIEDEKKLQLFWLLFFACIKTRQGIKFEENLNLIFGKHAYLFSTIYKLFDSMVKTLSSASSCQLTSFSFKCRGEQSEDAYYVLLNRFCLVNNLVNSKILRFTYNVNSKVLYLNYMDSYYKSEEAGKDLIKKRSDINKQIEIYTSEYFQLQRFTKKIKPNQMLKTNELEYTFEGSTIKMQGHKQKEDLYIYKGSKPTQTKVLKRDLKRAQKLLHQLD